MGSGRYNPDWHRSEGRRGFTLLEVVAALAILALMTSSIMVVINRCVASAANSALRREAFTLARENLEKVLVATTIAETVEYGRSDTYANITWQTVVSAFPEPTTGQMWARAVCSAEYVDSKGETQTVELEHWLSALTDQQADQLMEADDLEQLEADQLLATIEAAAEYAGVNIATVEQWAENGLARTEDGQFIRYNLDVFVKAKGDPTPEEKAEQVESVQELAMKLRQELMSRSDASGEASDPSGVDPVTGLPYEQLEEISIDDVMKLLRERQE